MALPVEINPLQLQTSGSYSIAKSLRFRSSASAYLNRTQGAPTNGYIWTWSGWVKRGTLGSTQMLFSAGASTYEGIQILGTDVLEIFRWNGSAYTFQIDTTQVFRDPSSWYHIVVAVDGTQATAANRVKLYVNGAQVTAFTTATYPVQNTQYEVNQSATAAYTSRAPSATQYFDGYMAEVNFIDGQALTPSSFGAYDTNGVWQPKKYSGTYGTNGFYLPFGTTTSTATLGNDSSGNGNTWTVNNISLTAGSTYDSMTDSPTVTSASVANYATLNPLNKAASLTLSNANLSVPQQTISGALYGVAGTLGMSSGKWYFEIQINGSTAAFNDTLAGVIKTTDNATNGSDVGFLLQVADQNKTHNYGALTTVTGITGSTTNVIQVALDVTNGKIWFGADGTWTSSGDPSAGTSPNYSSGISGFTWVPFINYWGAGTGSRTANANFGQRPFAYSAPTGFNALNTYNLPTPTIANGAKYMAATTYTGTGASLTIANSANNTIGTTFQPDFVWMKGRSGATDHALYDVVRGTTKDLVSNTTAAETTQATGLTAFGSTGFTIGALAKINTSAATYVGWQWLAGNSSGSSNTNGSITSTVSANTTAGFSVVTYTGTGAAATIGHGLGAVASFIIIKNRQAANSWAVYHVSVGANQQLLLNSTNAISADTQGFTATPSSTVFSVGTGSSMDTNQTTGGGQHVAYCWAAVAGYSAFGSYAGTGANPGPFVYLGFRPRWIMFKNSSAATDWVILDTSRDTYNQFVPNSLVANTSGAEATTNTWQIDALSNGMTIRNTSSTLNGSTNTIIYAAYAENPFQNSRAR
jgi:hypothetical protein